MKCLVQKLVLELSSEKKRIRRYVMSIFSEERIADDNLCRIVVSEIHVRGHRH